MKASTSFTGFATSCAVPASALRRRAAVRDSLARVVDGARARLAPSAAPLQVPPRLPLPDTFRF